MQPDLRLPFRDPHSYPSTVGGKPRESVGVRRSGQEQLGPTASDPHQLLIVLLNTSGNVNQRARGGKTILSGSAGPGLQDALNNGDRRAQDHKLLVIEWDGHQVSSLRINQVSGGRVAWVRCTLNQVPALTRPERFDGNVCVGPIEARLGSGKEHGLSARQELRPAVAELPFLESCQRLRLASRV